MNFELSFQIFNVILVVEDFGGSVDGNLLSADVGNLQNYISHL
jgi:hypothetical protein